MSSTLLPKPRQNKKAAKKAREDIEIINVVNPAANTSGISGISQTQQKPGVLFPNSTACAAPCDTISFQIPTISMESCSSILKDVLISAGVSIATMALMGSHLLQN